MESEDLKYLEKLAILLSLPGTALLVLLPLYIKALGGSSELVGIASSVGPLTFAFVRLLGGAATDVFGRKKTFIFGLAMYTLGLLLLAIAKDANTVALGGSLTGAGAMIAMTSAIVIVADIAAFAKVYGRLASKMALGGVLGSMVPLATFRFLDQLTAFRASFTIYFLIAIYATLLSFKLKETMPKRSRITFEWSNEWFFATLIGSMSAIGTGIVTPFYPLYISSKFRLDALEVMFSYAPSALSATLSPYISGMLSPHLSLVIFNVIGVIGSSAIVVGGLTLAALGLALVIGASGGGAVAQDALVAKGCKKSCGFMIGLYTSITQLFMGMGSLIGGILYSQSQTLTFLLASLAFLMASIISFAYYFTSHGSGGNI